MESFAGLLSWRYIVATTGIYFASVAFYRLFFHPLARFPGPRLAALSRWYEAYYNVIQNGQYISRIVEMHKRYGRYLIPKDVPVNSFALFSQLQLILNQSHRSDYPH
jgi:hypothetical protein